MFANPPLIDRDLEQVAIGIDNEVMEYHIKAKSKFWPGSRFPRNSLYRFYFLCNFLH